MRSLYIGATGMLAQQTNVDVIANNLANMNTTAYTKRRAEFNDLLYQNIIRPGSSSTAENTIIPSGIQLGLGVQTAAVYRITEGGGLVKTDNSLDLAIKGRGYFQVELPEGKGTGYTRDGAFQRNGDGVIVTHDGYVVQPEITIPEDAVEVFVNSSGEVWVKQDGETDEINVGQLELATFVNEAGLEAIGDNLFTETAASGAPVLDNPDSEGFGAILQGYLATSNVNAVTEITELVSAQRAYEMNSKIISTSDQMLTTINQLK
ncbi:MAG: flagellar basal-body rod protein FlgG [Alphaproteobacteria bacterium]|nr:flagellar basal-body rod protein FlgG [Alphaproteobacteria bacterium]MBQ7285461.1 flagellar basal-body rod protein FlgG [Alphaproteobacteria bacterium]